jgi:hypothetical protein
MWEGMTPASVDPWHEEAKSESGGHFLGAPAQRALDFAAETPMAHALGGLLGGLADDGAAASHTIGGLAEMVSSSPDLWEDIRWKNEAIRDLNGWNGKQAQCAATAKDGDALLQCYAE